MWYIDNALVDQKYRYAQLPDQFERATASCWQGYCINYRGKYLFNASFRNDGTSGFANNPNQNFGQ
jgi:hypothetical protein